MITSITDLVSFLQQYHRSLLEAEPPQPLPPPPADCPIPSALQKLYDAMGHHIDGERGLLSYQDHLNPPSSLRRKDHEVLFLNENQGCWSCTYDTVAPGNPVYCYGDSPQGVQQTDTLEAFLITFALQETVMSSPWLLAVNGTSSADSLGIEFSDLHRHGRYAYDGPSHDFWITPERDVLCMNTTGAGLWLASYSPRVLDLRLPQYEYQIISPDDYGTSKTNGDTHEKLAGWIDGITRWFRRPGK